jgi:Pro-kumamolisin, activation domain
MSRRVFKLVLTFCLAIGWAGTSSAESTDTFHMVTDPVEHELEGKHTHVYKESIPLLSSRNDLIKIGRSEHHYVHEIVFAVKSRNMEELTRMLHDVSDPHSQNYGMHMKKEEIDKLVSNPGACTQLTAYLHANGATSLSETPGGGYITAADPLEWRNLRSCQS